MAQEQTTPNTTASVPVDPKKAEKKAKKKAIRENRKQAYAKLVAAIETSKDQAVKDAYKDLRSIVGVRETGSTNFSKFVQYVTEKKKVHEDEVFKNFKIGRKDAAGFIRKFLKSCEAKDRVWINFTPSDGTYNVIGTGPKPPKEYTGYVPVDGVAELKQPELK